MCIPICTRSTYYPISEYRPPLVEQSINRDFQLHFPRGFDRIYTSARPPGRSCAVPFDCDDDSLLTIDLLRGHYGQSEMQQVDVPARTQRKSGRGEPVCVSPSLPMR